MVDDKKHSITTGVDGPSTSHVSVKRLSFEILSQIFLDCLPETGFPSVWTHEAPVILGRICSQWRSVSLRTPQLWAGLDLGSNRTDYTKDAMAAAEWKTRAGSCLLSYCLWHTPDILDVILPHCTQWRHFEAHLELDGWKQVYAAICQGAPRLQYLELHMINRPLSLWSATQIDIRVPIPGATGLQTLCACMGFKIHLQCIETPSLKRLDFDRLPLSLDDCWSCFRYFPNLAHFLATCDKGHPFTFHSDIVEAKALKHFQLTLRQAGFDRLLDVIHAQSLGSLKFKCHYSSDDYSIGVPPMLGFLERSGARLLDMNIDAPMTSDQIIQCLHHTPALISLQLHNCLLNDAVIQELTLVPKPAISQSHDNGVCPELKQIVFAQVEPRTFLMSSDVMTDMILSRWVGPSNGGPDEICGRKLRSILLDGLDFENDRAISEERIVMQCIEEGLEIVEQPPDYDFAHHDQSYGSSGSWSGSSSSDHGSQSE